MFGEYINRVFDNAKTIIGVDNQLLDNSLLSVFKNKSYSSFVVTLQKVNEELLIVKKNIETINEDTYIALDIYIESLLSFASTLSMIAVALNDKANSKHYSISNYKDSLNNLDLIKHNCQKFQQQLLESLPTIEDDDVNFLYEQAADEVENKTYIVSMWSKVFTEASGNESEAIALYIKQRVQQLTKLIESPPQKSGWNYYIGENWLYFESYITNMFYERGNGEIRTIYDGEIIDIPFEEIVTADGSLKYSASRAEGLVSIIKNRGVLMPKKNAECDSLLSTAINEIYDMDIYWDDIDSIILNNSASEIVVSWNKNKTTIKI